MWWVILALSVLPDLLFIPVGLALYLALKAVNRDAMLVATAFVLLFVALDLAVTWPNYAALITVAEDYAAATTDAQRSAAIAAATYASAVLGSTLAGVYSIVTLAVGILMIGVVMLRGVFSRLTAYLGIASGVLSIASVVGSVFVSALGNLIIFASLITTIWVFLVGFRLYRMGQ